MINLFIFTFSLYYLLVEAITKSAIQDIFICVMDFNVIGVILCKK